MTPLRWELTMNGNRPTALLKVLGPAANTGTALLNPTAEPAFGRTVVYVGDLIGAKKPIVAIQEIAQKLIVAHALAYGFENNDLVRCYAEGELIIVTGTADEIRFVRDTIEALKLKAEKDRARLGGSGGSSGRTEPKATPAETKAP